MVKATEGNVRAAKYQQIVDDFQRAIAEGAYKFNDQLPTEAVLMDEYSVSRPTAHRAMVELEGLGLVEVRRGVGTFVRVWKPILRNIGKRMSAEVWGAGKSVWSLEADGREQGVDSERRQRIEAPAHVAAQLGESNVWMRKRRHLVDERPVMLSTSYYPASIVDRSPITEADTGPGGSPARLADLGHAIATGSERLRGRIAQPDERKVLQLPKGGYVVEIARQLWDATGRTVEVTEMIAVADAFVFQFDYTS